MQPVRFKQGNYIVDSVRPGADDGGARRSAVLLSVFGDESADETKQRVFAVAGVIGTDAMWGALETAWKERTRGIPFHAKDCESDQGDYEHTAHAENQSLYRDLVTLLAESGLCGFGFAIDLQAQRSIFPDAPDLAYYKGFAEVVTAMTNFAVNNRNTVKFTFDMRKESEHNAGLLYGMFRERSEVDGSMFRHVTFAFSSEEPKIQVADLMAREAMKALDNQVGPVKRDPRKSWMALYETERFKIEVIGKDWFESLRYKLKAMQEESGIRRGVPGLICTSERETHWTRRAYGTRKEVPA